MKRNILVIFLFILCFILGTFTFDNKEVNEVSEIKSNNLLSMMMETEAGSGEYEMQERSSWPTKDDGYVFNETLSKCENGGFLSWNEDTSSVVIKGSVSDKCYAYFDKAQTLVDWVIAQYNNQTSESETIYYHDSNLENGAGDNSYRYSGASSSVNNYVCFGSDEVTCPNDNLYRIIGVFDDRVRLIKYDYVVRPILGKYGGDGIYSYEDTSYYLGNSSNLTKILVFYWSGYYGDYYNDWSYSDINGSLNNSYISYLDNIDTKWANMIDATTWKVGGNTDDNIIYSNAKTVYTNEIINPSTEVVSTYESKVGLMYVSDYGFAASPSAWTITLGNYSENYENWIYMGLSEWTITRVSSNSDNVYGIFGSGCIVEGCSGVDTLAVRPVFHLKSDVLYKSGSGTKEDSIRIN